MKAKFVLDSAIVWVCHSQSEGNILYTACHTPCIHAPYLHRPTHAPTYPCTTQLLTPTLTPTLTLTLTHLPKSWGLENGFMKQSLGVIGGEVPAHTARHAYAASRHHRVAITCIFIPGFAMTISCFCWHGDDEDAKE